MGRSRRLLAVLLFLAMTATGCASTAEYPVVRLQQLDPALAEPVISGITNGQDQLRVGSAALISPVETLKSYSSLYNYLAATVDRSAEVYQRHTYAETNELVRSGGVDLALVCSYAYVLGQREFGMEAIAVPMVKGKPEYYSYIIVRADSGIRKFDDLKGRTFAFTDPISTSGRLYAESLVADRHGTPQQFFRQTTFTFSHDNSIKAVADGLVDGAAVDSLVYDQKLRQNPPLGQRLTIIAKSAPFGAPPIVVNPKLDPDLKRRLQTALLQMHTTPEGQRILAELNTERFVAPDDRWYDSVRQLAEKVRGK
jgi:phosphonate transport system substrate-binding protein